jgi:Fic family protein
MPAASADLLSRALGRLDGALTVFGETDLVPMLLRAEAVASCKLDGNQASLLDLIDAEAGLSVAGPAGDVAALRALTDVATNHLDAIHPKGAGSAAWLLEVHGALMKQVGHPGVGWRSAPLWIGASGATRAEARHIPPPPDQIPSLMRDWEQSNQNDASNEPWMKLSRGLAGLETIHPFTEANARVARLWLQYALIKAGVLRHPLLLWSVQMQRQRHEARQAIQALRSGDETDAWTPLFTSMLRHAADETTDAVSRAAALRARHRKLIAADFGRAVSQGLRLLDALFAKPMVDIKAVIALTGVTFPAANELVRRFEQSELLVEVTGNSRNRRFRYAPFVRIFLDNE